jgi:hypothetical protein
MKKFWKIFALLIVLAALVGCSGGEKSCHSCTTEPPICTVTLTATPTTFEAAGGSGTGRAQASSGCALCAEPATASASWIVINSENNGDIAYSVTSNTGGERSGSISKCGKSVTITQKAATVTPSCNYTPIPAEAHASCEEGDGSVSVVVTGDNCPINGVSDSSWLTITQSCPSCNVVKYHYTKNTTGTTRLGHITIGNCTFTITQESCATPPACMYTVTPSPLHFSCSGGHQTVTVTTTRSDCGWKVENLPSWLTASTTDWVNGTGTVTITATSNSTVDRFSTITIAGQPVQVSQDACVDQPFSCTREGHASIPVTETFTCPNGSVQSATVTVTGSASRTSHNSCEEAQSLADAAAQAEANSKVADARVQARAQAQAKCPSCTFSVPPNTPTFSCEGGNGSVVVSSTCPWTASTSTPGMVTINGGSSGTGNGSVQFTVSNNSTGAARNGNITISMNGQTRTVSIPQNSCVSSNCEFAVPPTTPTVSSSGTSNGSLVINGTPGCSWSASAPPADTFIFLTGTTSGTFPSSGSASVQFTVAGNSGAARTGHIKTTVAGVTKTTDIPQSAYPN